MRIQNPLQPKLNVAKIQGRKVYQNLPIHSLSSISVCKKTIHVFLVDSLSLSIEFFTKVIFLPMSLYLFQLNYRSSILSQAFQITQLLYQRSWWVFWVNKKSYLLVVTQNEATNLLAREFWDSGWLSKFVSFSFINTWLWINVSADFYYENIMKTLNMPLK